MAPRRYLLAIFVVLVYLAGQGQAFAQKVLVYGGPAATAADVQAKLIASGAFDQVDVLMDGMSPTTAQFQAYDAAFVFADNGFANPVTLGNVLADYVDGGGGLVLAGAANVPGLIAGRLMTGNYMPFSRRLQVRTSDLHTG